MPSGLGRLRTLLSLPLVAAQGARVRRTIEVLPDATGANSGAVGSGDVDALRLVVVGESTAAGCGLESHDEGMAAALARVIAAKSQRGVHWQVYGQSGASLRSIRTNVLPQWDGSTDVAVLLAGVNDVLARRHPGQWAEELDATLHELTGRSDLVVAMGIPPFEAFPSLPRALGRFLAAHARQLDAVSEQRCVGRDDVQWVRSDGLVPIDPAFFARDGFHPSAAGYARWAEALAPELRI